MRHLLLSALLVTVTGCGPDTKPKDQPAPAEEAQSAAAAETTAHKEQPTAPAEKIAVLETPSESDKSSAEPVVEVLRRIPLEKPPGSYGGSGSYAVGPKAKVVAGGTGAIKWITDGKISWDSGEVLLWDAGTGKLMRTLGQHQESVNWLSFSHDGRILASFSSGNRLVQIWELPSGRRLSSFELPGLSHMNADDPMVLSPDGAWLATVVTEKQKLANLNGLNSIDMRFVPIPAGAFTRGQGKSAHTVTLTQSFQLGQSEVTQKQYKRVMRNNPSGFKSDSKSRLARKKYEDYPVETVNWSEAVEFCRKLSAMPQEKSAGFVYRLPTDAEWEYASRAGTTTGFSFGDDSAEMGNYGWLTSNSQETTHPVGQKKPNAWGLYDMYGNVWEWCLDWDGGRSSGSSVSVTDPTGPASGLLRVFRGGGWKSSPRNCRPDNRGKLAEVYRGNTLGFRVVRTLARPVNKPTTAVAPSETTIDLDEVAVQRLLGVWDTRSGNLKWSLPNPEVHCLAADGESLAGLVSEIFWRKWADGSGSSTGKARGKQSVTVWDAVNGQIKWQTDPGEGLSLRAVRFDPARPRLLGFCWRKLASWDLSSGKPLDQRDWAMGLTGLPREALRLSSDGRTAGVLRSQKNVEVWNIENMKQLVGLSFPDCYWMHPAFSPDLKLLVGDPSRGAPVILHLNWTDAGTQR